MWSKSTDDWVSGCRGLAVDGARGVGRGMKTWKQCLDTDMKDLNLTMKDAQNRTKWRVYSPYSSTLRVLHRKI